MKTLTGKMSFAFYLFLLSQGLIASYSIKISWLAPNNVSQLSGFSGNTGLFSTPAVIKNEHSIQIYWLQDVTFNDETWPIDQCDIYYSKSFDRGLTWTAPERLTWRYFRPGELAVASFGKNIHIIYIEYAGRQLYYLRSSDNGIIWTSQIIYTDRYAPHDISLAVSGEKVHVAWNADQRICYINSNDNGISWTAVKSITPSSNSYWSPYLLASEENVYLFYHGRNGSNEESFFVKSQDNGENWSLQNKHPVPGYLKSAAANNSNIFVCIGDYFSRSFDYGNSWDEQEIINIEAMAVDNNNAFLLFNKPAHCDLAYMFSIDNGETWINDYSKGILREEGNIFEGFAAFMDSNNIFVIWGFYSSTNYIINEKNLDTYFLRGDYEIVKKKGLPIKR